MRANAVMLMDFKFRLCEFVVMDENCCLLLFEGLLKSCVVCQLMKMLILC